MAFSIAFLAGVLALVALPELPPLWVGAPLLVVALLPLLLRRPFPGAIIFCGVSLGLLYAGVHAHEYLRERWPAERADDRVIADVIVATIPVARDGAWSFDGIATLEAPKRVAKPLRLRLISRDAANRPRAGERWRLLLALRPPRARVNPGAADVERGLFHDRVHAFGTVLRSSINRRIDAGHRPLAALRERIARHIEDRVADRDAAALISALAVGVTGGMSREQWRVFNATGTTHLVAISGLHVTLFAVVSFAVARWLWRIALWRFTRCPRETFAAVVGFVAALAYATLAGLSVPTQRTLIMLGVWLLARSVARASAPFRSFAFALAAVLVLDPFAPLAAGFWLSFGAMGAIVLMSSARFVRRPLIQEALSVQAGVTVALTPLTLASFGSLSAAGPLVNLAAIPAMSWVFVPTILVSVVLGPLLPAASNAALALAEWMYEVGWPWLAWASDLPWALIHANPPLWWYVAAVPAVVVSLMPLPLSLRAAAVLWLMPLAFAGTAVPVQGSAEITVLDVGEGTAIVVRTAAHVLVYDTGDTYGTDGHIAENVVLPFLRSRGVHSVDTLVASELTPATSAGTTALLAGMPITETLVGGGAPADFVASRACGTVRGWQWDGVVFRVLRGDGRSTTESNSSDVCILLIEAEGGGRALLPGSIDALAERRLLSSVGDLRAHLVVIPRHGSDSASTEEFVRAVDARWAVVSGRRVRDAREKPAVARWQAHGAEVLATADVGAMVFRLGPAGAIEGPRAQRAPDSFRPLWRSLP